MFFLSFFLLKCKTALIKNYLEPWFYFFAPNILEGAYVRTQMKFCFAVKRKSVYVRLHCGRNEIRLVWYTIFVFMKYLHTQMFFSDSFQKDSNTITVAMSFTLIDQTPNWKHFISLEMKSHFNILLDRKMFYNERITYLRNYNVFCFPFWVCIYLICISTLFWW